MISSISTIQSFRTGETIHVWFCALHHSNKGLAEAMATATIMVCSKGRDAKTLFYDLRIFVAVAFVMELLKSLSEIMVVGDRMTFLVRS